MMEIKQEEKGKKGAFYIVDKGRRVGEIEYRAKGENVLAITHTEVDPGFRGESLGEDLVKAVVDHARSRQLSVDPICPYARKIIEGTDALRDVLA